MDVVFKSIYARACMGAGLAVLTGLRAFIPVGFLALYSRLEFRSAPILDGTAFAFLLKTWVIVILLVLAVAELLLDKVLPVSSTRDQILQPVKIVLGGMVFAAAMAPDGWIAMVVSGVLGLVIAGLADHVRRSMRPTTPPAKERRPRWCSSASTRTYWCSSLRFSSCWCRLSARWWPASWGCSSTASGSSSGVSTKACAY